MSVLFPKGYTQSTALYGRKQEIRLSATSKARAMGKAEKASLVLTLSSKENVEAVGIHFLGPLSHGR